MPRSHLPAPITIAAATPDDASALRTLWICFRHDMSSVNGELPDATGRFRDSRLHSALTDPAWAAWILRAADHPIGLAFVRALDQPERVLSSFFVVAAARRAGVGRELAHDVLARTPGRWAVAYQDTNTAAARFWPVVARGLDPDYALEHRAVPGKPHIPPDTWVRLSVGTEQKISRTAAASLAR